jgi:hypothetical protein
LHDRTAFPLVSYHAQMNESRRGSWNRRPLPRKTSRSLRDNK